MNRYIYFLFCLCLATQLSAQSVSQIKNDPAYIWGEGEGETLHLADENAIMNLSSEVAQHVTGVKRSSVHNLNDGKKVKSLVQFEQVMETYTSATLTNTLRMVLSDESAPMVKVFRYIKKSELDKIFASRIDKIKEMVRVASEALEHGQIDDAIRYYYWANMLLNSLRPGDKVSLLDGDKEVDASFFINRKLNEIFDNLEVKLLGKQEEGNNYEVFFLYKSRPVASLDYTYYVGNDWSHVNTARDGRGTIELRPGYTTNHLQIKYECLHYDGSQCDMEVNQVLKSVKPINYPKASITIPIVNQVLSSEKNYSIQSQQFGPQNTVTENATMNKAELTIDLMENYKQVISDIVTTIGKNNDAKITSYFTTQGYEVFNRLINYGKARVVGNDFELMFTELNGYVSCRSVPMRFSFSNQRSFVENVVFVFDPTGKIDNVQFGLSKVAQDDIFAANCQSRDAKEVLISFLETYRTAYALERLEYLESIFSDDALIITGSVVNKLDGSPELGFKTNRYVKLTQRTKSEYIRRLRNAFLNNEFINIKFANNEVMKMGEGGEIYAVQIKQDYFSSNYGDTGYLFLLVDVNNPQQPIIHVRAWQECPDPNWGLIGPGHF